MVPAAAGPVLGPAYRRCLREVFRSAGWPCQDMIELDLLADLKRPDKGEAYRTPSSECRYVLLPALR
jgi:hypothetical protein